MVLMYGLLGLFFLVFAGLSLATIVLREHAEGPKREQ